MHVRTKWQQRTDALTSSTQQEYRLLAQQVPEPPRRVESQHATPGVKRHRPLNPGAGRLAELPEILDRAEMNVGRFPPIVGKILGARHVAAEHNLQPDAPMTEIRKRHDPVAPDAQHVLKHRPWMARGLQRLRQDDVVESVVGIVREIGVGVALDHREALGNAFVHTLARKLDAASVHGARFAQKPQQLTVTAADIEHLGAVRDHVGDRQQVDARAAGRARRLRHGEIALEPGQHCHLRAGGRPRAMAAPSRKPPTIANNSGSSSRKASWPLSVTISANDTRAPPALSACTMARESEVGNSQSEVKEITQKRVGVFLKALASTPP